MGKKPAGTIVRLKCAVVLFVVVVTPHVSAQAPEAPDRSYRSGKAVVTDNAKLPRLTYRMLLNDHDFLKGEKFYGTLYPIRVSDVPSALRRKAGADTRLLKASITSRKHALYVIIPKSGAGRVSEFAKKKKQLSIVYTPLGVHAGLPLISLIEEIGAESGERISTDFFATGIARYYPAPKGARWTIAVGRNVRLLEYEISASEKGKVSGIRRESVPGRPESEKITPFRVDYTGNSIAVAVESRDANGQASFKSDVLVKGPLKKGVRWISSADGVERQREILSTNDTVVIGEIEYRDVLVVREDSRLSAGDDSTYVAVTYYFYAPGVGFIGCKIDSAESPDSIRPHGEIHEWFMSRIE